MTGRTAAAAVTSDDTDASPYTPCYRRAAHIWFAFRKQAELDGMPAINAKRVLPDHAPECVVV